MDDIQLTGSDPTGLVETKEYLRRYFVTKDMGKFKYFLRIEVAQKSIVYFFLNESILWIFLRRHDFWGGCNLASTPVEVNVDLWFDGIHTLDDPGRYRRLIEKLTYLTAFADGVLSRFMHQPREVH